MCSYKIWIGDEQYPRDEDLDDPLFYVWQVVISVLVLWGLYALFG